MADQTHDEESRHRCLWLAQTYLRLAELEELPVGQNSDITGEGEEDPRPTLPPTH
jgi:hypothetical protein